MKQVILDAGAVRVHDVAEPQLDQNSVLVAVSYSWVSSGTERATIGNAGQSYLVNAESHARKLMAIIQEHGVAAAYARVRQKMAGTYMALGYSSAGRVIAVGSRVKSIRMGDYVACGGAGYAHHAGIVCVPENLTVVIKDPQFLKQASIATIGAIALQGIRRAQVELGHIVCVQGLGLIGQLAVRCAKRAGATVIGIDRIPERLERARLGGADRVLNVDTDDVMRAILFATEHHGVDSTIVTAASSSNMLMQQAMEMTRKRGIISIVGDVGLSLERQPFYEKEIDVRMSCSYGPGRYDATYERDGQDYPYAFVRWTERRNMEMIVRSIEAGALDIDALCDAVVPVAQAPDAYEKLAQGALGVVLSYEAQEEPQPIILSDERLSHERFRVGVLGVGGFAQSTLLPLLRATKKASIVAVADLDQAKTLTVARAYEAIACAPEITELIEQQRCDVVVIATPHNMHADQVCAALEAGKSVFCEKPLVTTHEQLWMLQEFLKSRPDARLCVDFNRSFAPLVGTIQELIAQRTGPIMATYRMNVGYLDPSVWVHTEQGGGRLIGEACHIIDLFHEITGSRVCSISVAPIGARKSDLLVSDNAAIQLMFFDGSVCTLMYTALGHTALGKERMEIACDGMSLVMDDYTTLTGFGVSRSYRAIKKKQDKGHAALMAAFFEALEQSRYVPPIAYDRLLDVTRITLVMHDLAQRGGGYLEFS